MTRLESLIRYADGDSRRALNCLETAAVLALESGKDRTLRARRCITADIIAEAGQYRTLRYDTSGEEHYNQISALHKSLRDSDPDGAVYWLSRMLEAARGPAVYCPSACTLRLGGHRQCRPAEPCMLR